MRKIVLSKQAATALQRMPQTDAKRITKKLQQYSVDPASLANNVKRLQGSDHYRLRIGDWRVIFNETGIVIDVVKIAPRGDVYKEM
ncbi:cytotoxic translational repressor of toxin-antitoxin stability system [Pararhizobium polonicum]|uniref:Cytotoxic translational repressor of toxin-antitoxin stability system n=1 Tax=Pararhizobium polonicum TaxID=1612624 RepID=A0A1C7NW55_9HYPH|nr:type II toxin-antitoxin system RelE/ParE family toxin [Pararhizobium polonicum]OBZ93219.1 cytotoxic translational repressor of toxin-antitoxin stability system [Pararhizobium polonicum]